MTVPYRKKLIEVSLPLAAINAESAREKSIRHGHPSTLHLWWARRPLAACRAVLFASLVDDPDSDPQYRRPDGTVDEEAAGIKRADLFNLIEELVAWENSNNPEVIRTARAEIARCVASRKIEIEPDFGFWIFDFGSQTWVAPGAPSNNPKSKIENPKWTVRDLVRKGHCRPQPGVADKKAGRKRFLFDVDRLPPAEVVNRFLAEHAPPVLDPFAGGGSIPLEAQRLGLRAYASDLNPVAVLINKALIEIPPKFAGRPPVNPEWQRKSESEKASRVWEGAQGLAEDVRYYGQWMRDEAEKRIGHLYPKVEVTAEMAKDRPDLKEYVGQKLTVIAWLWARTVASPDPAANSAHVPLVRSFWLSTKKSRSVFARPVITRNANAFRFEICAGTPPSDFDPKKGTVVRTGATCVLTGTPIPFDHIRAEGKAGRLGTRLIALVADGKRERVYLPPPDHHVAIAESAKPCNFPETDLPQQALSFRVMLYGMDKHYKLFSSRQLVALTTFSDLVEEARKQIVRHASSRERHNDDTRLVDGGTGPVAHADAVATYLAFGVSKMADRGSTICSWFTARDSTRPTFARQALPMTWDFAEVNTLLDTTGSFLGVNQWTVENLESLGHFPTLCTAAQLDASAASTLCSSPIVSTDPPYYDNIGYADLSDFFYTWLRRTLHSVYPSLFATLLTPKSQELIASPFRHEGSKDRAQVFFEEGMVGVFSCLRESHQHEFPLTVYYAFKQAETDEDSEADEEVIDSITATSSTGWETMLAGLIRSRLGITGTWPIRTELGNRMVGSGANALASSIVLVCRPRPDNAPLATRKEFITTLRRELPEALRNLQRGNIAPVDLAQAAIGPGMAVFTRYSKVLESDGSSMSVRTALGLINQTLDEVLAEQEGEFDGDTRWALAWFEQFGMEDGPFGDAETLSKAKNTAINGLVDAGIVSARAGRVRLVRRDELPAGWNPATDKRLAVWEVTQHLIRRLDQKGETGAAELVQQLGSVAEIARDLAYRLYSTCERKKWAQEALAYNSLVVAWPELAKLALSQRTQPRHEKQNVLEY